MLRFLADENFDNRILNRLRAAIPNLDAIRVQDTLLYQASDPDVLEWAAIHQRIVLTHDVHTMPGYAFERVNMGQPMPGVIEVALNTPLNDAIEDLLIMIQAGTPEDFNHQVRYIPIR